MLLLFDHHVVGEKMPEIEANLAQLLVLNATHLCEVGQPLQGLVSKHLYLLIRLNVVREALNEVKVVVKD